MQLYHIVYEVESDYCVGDWDNLTKMLVRAHPQDLVSLVLRDTHYLESVTTELKVQSIAADFMCKVERNGETFILHVEFQKSSDATMGERTWEYNCSATMLEKLPVYSFVIYLTKGGTIDQPPFRKGLKGGEQIHTFHYTNIYLWEMPPEVLMQEGLEGLLPLLPLTKGAELKRDQIVDAMISGLQRAGKEDVLALSKAFAGLVYPTKDDKQAIKRRFAMFQAALEDSWFYKEVIEQGIEQGRQQGIEEGVKALRLVLIRVVEMRFPELLPLAREEAEHATIPAELSAKVDKLLIAYTVEEARRVLQES
jgi:predicted transposase YdaD